jgi:hypothetical protein
MKVPFASMRPESCDAIDTPTPPSVILADFLFWFVIGAHIVAIAVTAAMCIRADRLIKEHKPSIYLEEIHE